MNHRLKKYYKKCGLIDSKCKHYKSCIKQSDNPNEFENFKEISNLGKKYEEGRIPRLLFISLDPGPKKGQDEKKEKKLPRGKHWHRTLEFVWHFFNKLNKKYDLRLDIGVGEGDDYEKIYDFFAHTNTAKCALNNRRQAPSIVFKNCREFLLGEIEILNPEIIVTQGSEAYSSLSYLVKKKNIVSLKEETISKARKPDYHIIKLPNGKIILWIHHYHPQSHDKKGNMFKRYSFKNYNTYLNIITEFIKKNYPDKIRKIARL